MDGWKLIHGDYVSKALSDLKKKVLMQRKKSLVLE